MPREEDEWLVGNGSDTGRHEREGHDRRICFNYIQTVFSASKPIGNIDRVGLLCPAWFTTYK